MVRWTKKHPLGAHLLNILITIFIVWIGILIVESRLKNKYGNKIDEMYIDTKTIMNVVIKLPSKDTTNHE